jgi:outer membrane protein
MILLLLCHLAVADTVTLEQALRTADANQPVLEQQRALARAAWARAGETRAGLLPQVTAGGSVTFQTLNHPANTVISSTGTAGTPGGTTSQFQTQTPPSPWQIYDGINANITASQLIIDGWSTPHRWLALKAAARGQEDTVQSNRVLIAYNVRTAFYNVLAQKALLGVAQESLSNIELHLKQTQGYVDTGVKSQIDLAIAKTNYANAKVALINAENALLTSKAQLNTSIGVERDLDYDVAEAGTTPLSQEALSRAQLLDAALAARPEVQSLKEQIHSDELLVKADYGTFAPTLSAQTGFTEQTGYTEANKQPLNPFAWNWNAQLVLQWNLFQGLLSVEQVKEARANREAAQAQLEQERQQVKLDVDQGWLALRAAQQALTASGEALESAEEQLHLAEGRYQTGAGSAIELSDAQVARTTAAAQKVQAVFNVAAARAQVQRALGQI